MDLNVDSRTLSEETRKSHGRSDLSVPYGYAKERLKHLAVLKTLGTTTAPIVGIEAP